MSVQASGSWDKTIRIWKPTTSSLLFQLKGHGTWVKSLAFSPDELRLASVGYSHMVSPFLQTNPSLTFPEVSAILEMSMHSRGKDKINLTSSKAQRTRLPYTCGTNTTAL